MPSMKIDVPHQLGQDEAVRRLKHLMDNIKEKYHGQVTDLTEEWADHSGTYSFKVMGFTIKGTMQVDADAVHLHGELPFAAMMFKGKIESGLRDAVTKTLAS